MENKRPFRPVRLTYGTGEFQFGDLYLPDAGGPHPVAILIHGGYWRAHYGGKHYTLDMTKGLAEDLAMRGIAAWNIEYRRVRNLGGGWPGTFLDVALATDYLATIAASYGLDLQRVVPVGHSAGGHLALWLAARSCVPIGSSIAPQERSLPLSGVISLAGVLDLDLAYQLHLGSDAVVELLGGGLAEVPERYAAASPATLVPVGISQVIVHGTADDNVPMQVSQRYVAKARAVGDRTNYLEVASVAHFDLIDASTEVWAMVREELRKLMEPSMRSEFGVQIQSR